MQYYRNQAGMQFLLVELLTFVNTATGNKSETIYITYVESYSEDNSKLHKPKAMFTSVFLF